MTSFAPAAAPNFQAGQISRWLVFRPALLGQENSFDRVDALPMAAAERLDQMERVEGPEDRVGIDDAHISRSPQRGVRQNSLASRSAS